MVRELLIVLLVSLGASARRQLVGNPGAIAAAIAAANRNKQTSHQYGSASSGPPGPNPAELARAQAKYEQEVRERNQEYKESMCSQTPCEVGTKVRFMRSISRGKEQQVEHGETATVMEHHRSGSSDMYTVESDCQTLKLQVAALILQRSSSRKCPDKQQMRQETQDSQDFDAGDEVVTTENKAGFFDAGEVGVVRKVVHDGSAYKVCLGGQVQKTFIGLMTGGTKCSEGREVQIAARLLRHK